jgi:hypothetical protein
MSVATPLLAVQFHDPARGPFEPTVDSSTTVTMRHGKTADSLLAVGDRVRHQEAGVRRQYTSKYKPTNASEYRSRVLIRFRKNREAGCL